MSDCVLALDVGGTTMKGALIDAEARVIARRTLPTLPPTPSPRTASPAPGASDPSGGVSGALDGASGPSGGASGPSDGASAEGGATAAGVSGRIGDAFEELAALAPRHGLDPPRAAGLVVPGVVDEERGIAVIASNVPFVDTPLVEPLERRLGIPVRLGHDVRAGGLAETVLGGVREHPGASGSPSATNALFLPLGTGIAAACIVDGHPLNAGGYAGEIGHVVIDPEGDECNCGNRGCLERFASASAVARRYAASSGRDVAGADEVAELVRSGDPVARRVWDEAVDALVIALRMAITLLGSEVVIVGGGLGEAGDLLLEPLNERLQRALTFQRRPRLVPARLGDQAGCLGAGLLALRQAREIQDTAREAG